MHLKYYIFKLIIDYDTCNKHHNQSYDQGGSGEFFDKEVVTCIVGILLIFFWVAFQNYSIFCLHTGGTCSWLDFVF